MKRKSIRMVLLVDDNSGDTRWLRKIFNEQGATETQLIHVDCMSEAEKYLATLPADMVLLDLGPPHTRGLEAVRGARFAAPHVALVVSTGLDDESLTARSSQESAVDYLVKGQDKTSGSPRGPLRMLQHVARRETLEGALVEQKERAELALNCIGDAIICTDASGNITFLNVVSEKLMGRTLRAVAGQPASEVFRVQDADCGEVNLESATVPVVLDGVERLPSNRILVRNDGVVIPIEVCIAPIRDRDGKASGTVIVLRDVTAARAMAKQMTFSAQHDLLTGLPNRMLLNDRISQAIALAPRSNSKVAVLLLDLDGFKYVNDSLGHPLGDKLIRSIATRLVGCVRDADTVSRQGGDEFVILLSGLHNAEEATILSRRILKAVAEVHLIDHHDLHITTSIGVSIFPDDGRDAETLIKNADTAMYQAKDDGRQCYRFFKPAMNVRAVERQSVEESLRGAMKRHELTLQYQPKIDLATGAITGAEALLRWTHPTRGLVSPATFIPVAEDCGLILPIGAWVLRQACAQARLWLDEGLNLGAMAVNVSAMEFRDESFLYGLFEILAETGLDPEYLELELTESVLMKQVESSTSILQTLRDRGVKIAIDDFGTGYSSLSYLRKFSVDALKIDQSFVRQITTAGDDAVIVTTVINMARSLKLRVVAEGVETLREVEFLRARQCDEAQGFYFSRPVPPQNFAALLRSGSPKVREISSSSLVPDSEIEVTRGSGQNTTDKAYSA
jgi:diguanylate cyclase (GGDEF)-like protein/PAS domain S-box-containing protein